ncbi:hypothetical protein DOTSEDRAFT_74741 [Dothistroma septosporum NZE10]|uniref:Uncharacterized protein n=1 Tax=Dothistroma septosporum (strain NZE10 / CBS 128990) TaxID=675120 RepID=N1PD22_DOTSN|nr:hypothetical protein DOTSEDRAFT_74741 [Dothistroma septosporum NZE10]
MAVIRQLRFSARFLTRWTCRSMALTRVLLDPRGIWRAEITPSDPRLLQTYKAVAYRDLSLTFQTRFQADTALSDFDLVSLRPQALLMLDELEQSVRLFGHLASWQ